MKDPRTESLDDHPGLTSPLGLVIGQTVLIQLSPPEQWLSIRGRPWTISTISGGVRLLDGGQGDGGGGAGTLPALFLQPAGVSHINH